MVGGGGDGGGAVRMGWETSPSVIRSGGGRSVGFVDVDGDVSSGGGFDTGVARG